MIRKIFAKIAFVFSLIGCLATSCSNEDINIMESGKLEIRVSTQGLYDGFDMTSSIQQQILAKGSGKIGTYLFIYNEDGKLVFKGFQSEPTFNIVRFSCNNLTQGRYTAVAVETIVEEDDTSDVWEIIGADNLSTLAVQDVMMKDNYIPSHYWYNAVGVETRVFTLNGDLTFDMRPAGIGSIFLNHFVNFENSKYIYGAFATKNAVIARRLSPEYTGTDRFINAEYTDKDHIYIHTPFNIDEYDTQVDTYLLESGYINTSLCLASDDSGTWDACPASGYNMNIQDGRNYYAGAVFNGSSFSVNFVDTFSQLQDWVNTILDNSDNPEPTPSADYIKPYDTWGATTGAVNTYMTGKGFESGYKSEGSGENDYVYYYTPDKNITYAYGFPKSSNRLNSIVMIFDGSNFTLSGVRNFIAADYSYWTESDGMYFYSSSQTTVGVWKDDDGDIAAVFTPSQNNAPAYDKKLIKKLVPNKNKLLKRGNNNYMHSSFIIKK